jgi:hypothetical protein
MRQRLVVGSDLQHMPSTATTVIGEHSFVVSSDDGVLE